MLDQALGQGERHGGVVRPLPRREAEGAAAGHLGVERPRVAGRELQRGAEGVADREAKEAAPGAVQRPA